MRIPKPLLRLRLTALGASLLIGMANHLGAATTMNIEIDYMDSTFIGGHSHKPQADEIAAVVQMFACHGITLNAVVDEAIPHYDVMPHDPAHPNNFFGYTGTASAFGALRDTYFGHKGQAGWHYCIFGHQYMVNNAASGSSGLAETPGGNLVVTLGTFAAQIGTPFDRAATLAHEFGHNLGLGHGAFGPNQPNKPSIMSYFYQLNGVRSALLSSGLSSAAASLFKEMDYSEGGMCTLNEAVLSESFGSGMVSVDWNCNGQISGVVSASLDDASIWCGSGGADRNVLPDVNEWAIIHDTTFARVSDEHPTLPTTSCITSDEWREHQLSRGPGRQPPVASEPCVTARMLYLTPGITPSGSGLCSDPLTGVGLAQGVATDGSHLFLTPGNYTLDVRPLFLNRPMTIFCNIGSATVKPQ